MELIKVLDKVVRVSVLRWIRSIGIVILAVGFIKACAPEPTELKSFHSWYNALPPCAVYIMTRRCDKGRSPLLTLWRVQNSVECKLEASF